MLPLWAAVSDWVAWWASAQFVREALVAAAAAAQDDRCPVRANVHPADLLEHPAHMLSIG